jgi:hypothetical protein
VVSEENIFEKVYRRTTDAQVMAITHTGELKIVVSGDLDRLNIFAV